MAHKKNDLVRFECTGCHLILGAPLTNECDDGEGVVVEEGPLYASAFCPNCKEWRIVFDNDSLADFGLAQGKISMDTPKITPAEAVKMMGIPPEDQVAYTASREGIIKSRKDVQPLQESVSLDGKKEPVDWDLLEYQEYLDQKNQGVAPGTLVETTQENLAVSDWTKEARMSRQWGVQGTIVTHHDAHGLSYEVRHSDGSIGHYDPSEIEVIK